MKISNYLSVGLLGMSLITFTACDGILDGIYDEVEDEEEQEQGQDYNSDDTTGDDITTDDTTTDYTLTTDSISTDSTQTDDVETTTPIPYNYTLSSTGYGVISYDEQTKRGQIYINSTDYYTWTYISLHDFSMSTFTIDLDLDDPLADEPTNWDIATHRWDIRTNGGAAIETSYTSLDALEASGALPSGDYVEDSWYEYVSVDMSGMMSGNIGYLACYVNSELSKMMDVSTSTMPPTYTPSGKVYVVRLSDGNYIALTLSSYMNAKGTKGYLTLDFICPLEF